MNRTLGKNAQPAPTILTRHLSATMLWRRGLSTAVEASGKHVPWGGLGTGTYTAATKGCFDVIARCSPQMQTAMGMALAARAQAGTADQTPFNIADFGTADGGTSLPLLASLVSAVRAAEPRAPIVVHYEDQAMNDWQSVFRQALGELPGGPATYMDGRADNVYVLASGTSFYKQCFPPASIDLGFCATAMHWLTRPPANGLPDALHSAASQDSAAKASFASQAASDWESILVARAAELKSGGQLVVANFAVDDEGQYLGTSNRVGQQMHPTFSELWREVAGDAVHRATNFPNEYRPLSACVAPFAAGTRVSAAGLVLQSAECNLVECPFLNEWRAGVVTDAAEQARRFVPTTRTWSNSTFVAGALACGHSPAEAAAIADEMFARYEARVAADPDNHAMDYVHSYFHASKA